MKKIYIRLLSVFLIIVIVVPVMMGLTFNKEKKVIEALIYERSDIMDNMLSQTISIKKGRDMLKSIEDGRQFSNDMERLIDYMNTDYDKVISTDIVSLNKLNDVSDTLLYRAIISWTYSGCTGIYQETGSYLIGLKNVENGLKIVSFELE